jgi:hypothetical protein
VGGGCRRLWFFNGRVPGKLIEDHGDVLLDIYAIPKFNRGVSHNDKDR